MPFSFPLYYSRRHPSAKGFFAAGAIERASGIALPPYRSIVSVRPSAAFGLLIRLTLYVFGKLRDDSCLAFLASLREIFYSGVALRMYVR